MKSSTFANPVFWTFIGGVAVATLGYSQYRPTQSLAHPSLTVQAEPVRNLIPRPDLALSLKTLDEATSSLADYALPAVVSIETSNNKPVASGGIFGGGEMDGGVGSGVIIRPDGYILTNDHVVGGYDKVKVKLNDGRSFDGQVRRAQDSDLAVVKIEAKDLPSLAFGDSDHVRPGQMAMAIGSPYNLPYTVTLGHVSALNRKNFVPDARQGVEGQRVYYGLIQTDAAINRGNSGGPLIDVQGQIIGINTTIYSSSGGSNGIGFAIPGNEARIIADQLMNGKKVQRGALGVQPSDIPDYLKKDLKVDGGAYIEAAPQSNAPAAQAGLKQGDVIVRIGQVPIGNETDLRNSMLQYAPGTSVEVEYVRGGSRHTTTVKLATLSSIIGPPQPQVNPKGSDQAPGMNEDDLKKLFEDQDLPGIPQGRLRDLLRRQQNGGAQQAPRKTGEPAKLGVQVGNLSDQIRSSYHIPANVQGAFVAAVDGGSIAEGLGMQTGDVVTKIGDATIKSASDLVNAMKNVKWGDRVQVQFGRFGANSQSSQVASVTFQ